MPGTPRSGGHSTTCIVLRSSSSRPSAAWEVRDEGRRLGDLLLDQSLCGKEGQLQEDRRCMKIGLLFAQEKPADRPAMLDVRLMLHREKKTSKPKRPEYTKSRHPRHDGVFSCCF